MKEITDDEIQILGQQYVNRSVDEAQCRSDGGYDGRGGRGSRRGYRNRLVIIALIITAAILVGLLFYFFYLRYSTSMETVELDIAATSMQPMSFSDAPPLKSGIKIDEESINDVALRFYIPRNLIPELSLTLPDTADATAMFVTRAADIGKNNYGIVGDFVLGGERLARGVSKEGFCAVINQAVTIGVTTETSLLDEAIRQKGYFFRQYPLVKNGKPVFNRPPGKSIRRALAIREGEIMMVESVERESFYDFAQALADAGISEAIYLVGGANYGWYRSNERAKPVYFAPRKEADALPAGYNYLIWRKPDERK